MLVCLFDFKLFLELIMTVTNLKKKIVHDQSPHCRVSTEMLEFLLFDLAVIQFVANSGWLDYCIVWVGNI